MRFIVGLALIAAGAVLLWWWLGKPGLWLRDRMAWVRFVTPSDGAVVQWRGSETQNVRIDGATGWFACDLHISATRANSSIAGKGEWQPVESKLGRFSAETTLATGWNRITVRGRWWDHRFADSVRVALGDVFIVAGQSNAVGYAEEFFSAASDDVRAGRLGEDGAISWRCADDPQSPQGKGSPWPKVGDEYRSKTQLPVGFINIAENGSSIESWMPGGSLFRRLEDVLRATGPANVRAILWAQGEADSGMSADRYAQCLETIIRSANELTKSSSSVPWVVATSSYVCGAAVRNVRQGQEQVVASGLALRGPDTDALGPLHRQADGVHFNAGGTRALASLWADALKRHFTAERSE